MLEEVEVPLANQFARSTRVFATTSIAFHPVGSVFMIRFAPNLFIYAIEHSIRFTIFQIAIYTLESYIWSQFFVGGFMGMWFSMYYMHFGDSPNPFLMSTLQDFYT